MKEKVRKELEKILKKYKCDNVDQIGWTFLLFWNKVSEEFIREFVCFFTELDWFHIVCRQNISNQFIRDFKDTLDLDCMLRQNVIKQSFYNKLMNIKPLTRAQLLDL